MISENIKENRSRCSECAVKSKRGRIELCLACENYANQDYVAQKELPLSDWLLEKLGSQAGFAQWMSELKPDPDDDIAPFLRILEESELPERSREVLWLRFVEGASFSQIAQSLGVSKPSAFRRYHKAIGRLRGRVTNPQLVGNIHFLKKRKEEEAPSGASDDGNQSNVFNLFLGGEAV